MSTLRQQECLRCAHRWRPRQVRKARRCPRCKSPYWDRPRERVQKQVHTDAQPQARRTERMTPDAQARALSQDDSLQAALILLQELKHAGCSWAQMSDQMMERFGVKLEKDQLKALAR